MSYADFNAKLRILFDERPSGSNRISTRSTTANARYIYNTSGDLRPWRGQFPSASVGITSWGCNIGTVNGTYRPDWDPTGLNQIPNGVTYTAYVENKTSDSYPPESGTPPIVKTFAGRITTLPSIQ